ncbi:unnamed protein product [Urochloa humidicola]
MGPDMESQENAPPNAAATALPQPNLFNCRKRIVVQKRNGRPTPMPATTSSNNPVRRSPKVASMQQNDDDDFVEPLVQRPRIKVAGHKRRNDASTSQQIPSRRKLFPTTDEEDDVKKTGKTCCLCNPSSCAECRTT